MPSDAKRMRQARAIMAETGVAYEDAVKEYERRKDERAAQADRILSLNAAHHAWSDVAEKAP